MRAQPSQNPKVTEMATGATNLDSALVRRTPEQAKADLHPAWIRLMRYCAELGHGEIDKLKIQDGLPIMADMIREKVKFT
jgi:hypothetical protein